MQEAEINYFGTRYTIGSRELKGKKLLNTKTFRKADQLAEFDPEQRRVLAKACLDSGKTAGRSEMTALAQAKLAYVKEALNLCTQYRCPVAQGLLLLIRAILLLPRRSWSRQNGDCCV